MDTVCSSSSSNDCSVDNQLQLCTAAEIPTRITCLAEYSYGFLVVTGMGMTMGYFRRAKIPSRIKYTFDIE